MLYGIITTKNNHPSQNINLLLIYIFVLSFCLFGCNINKPVNKDISFTLGVITNSSDIDNSFLFYGRCYSDSKNKIIEMLESVEYTPTDKGFGESESVCITFNGKEKKQVWYAVEYDTEDVYAVFEENTYLIGNGTSLVKEIGSYLVDISKYEIINVNYPDGITLDSFEDLENGSEILGVGSMRSMRYFYNEDFKFERVVLLDANESTLAAEIDMYSVAELAAKTVGVQVYSAEVFHDDKTGMWAVKIIDNEDYQVSLEEAKKQEGFVALMYDKWWEVIIDSNGKPMYYIKSWND